jgi:hypothetical protein
MKPSLCYKISSLLLAFFGITHTIGMFRPREDEAARAVAESMRSVRFDVMGFNRSFQDFYMGFGLVTTVYLLFSAVLAWQLAGLAGAHARIVRTLAWPLIITQVAVTVLCWTNFFYPPAITSTLITAFLLAAVFIRERG